MKAIITGANGYLGKLVSQEAINQKFDETLVDSQQSRAKYVGVYTSTTTDIFSNDETLYEQFSKPDLAIHFDWKDGVFHNSHAHMSYLSDHFVFLHNLVKQECKNISVTGTVHEVEYCEGAIDENTPCNPLSYHRILKNALRQALHLIGSNVNIDVY